MKTSVKKTTNHMLVIGSYKHDFRLRIKLPGKITFTDCIKCPYGEVGMLVWCAKIKASHAGDGSGIPYCCPLPNA